MVVSELRLEKVLHNSNLIAKGVVADCFVRRWRLEDEASTADRSLVLCLVGAVHTVLEEMEWHTKRLQSKLCHQSQLAEAKEVLVHIFGKISTHELVAAIVESSSAVRTSMVAQSRPLRTVSEVRNIKSVLEGKLTKRSAKCDLIRS